MTATSAGLTGSPVTFTATGTAGAVSAGHTVISASPTNVSVDAGTSTITVQAKDQFDNNLTTSGGTVTLNSTIGTVGTVTDHGDGTYTATLTDDSHAVGVATVSGKIGGTTIGNNTTVAFTPGAASAANSTITADPTSINTDGGGSTITVQLKDQYGNNLTSGGTDTVEVATGLYGSTMGPVTHNLDGTYTAVFSSTVTGPATISGKVNGADMTHTATVNVVAGAVTHLVFGIQPSSAAAASISPAVTVELLDTNNNIVASDTTTTVSLAIDANPGGGVLTGGESAAVSNGVATFSWLSIDKAGTGYTLVASSGPAHGTVTSSAFDVTPAAQTISFPDLTGVRFDEIAPTPAASASSALPVTYSTTSTTCSVTVDGVITLLHAGDCTIAADQTGNGTYAPAATVSKTFTIAKGDQATLAITAQASATFGAADATITTSGGSGSGALSFDAGSSTACSIVAGKLHVISVAGTCTVTATKAADTDYNSATSTPFPITIAPGAQAILTITSTRGTYLTALTLTTSGGSGTGLVSYTVTDGTASGCSVSGDQLTSTSAGTCHVIATKAADAGYNVATSVAFDVTITYAPTTPTPAATPPTTSTGVGPGSDGSGSTIWLLVVALLALFGGLLVLVSRQLRRVS